MLKSNSVIWGYSHDIGMTFILEQVHFISMYFSVFVYMVPKQNFTQCKSFRTEFRKSQIVRAVWGEWRMRV